MENKNVELIEKIEALAKEMDTGNGENIIAICKLQNVAKQYRLGLASEKEAQQTYDVIKYFYELNA